MTRHRSIAGYRSKQCGHGRYLWRTPHGLTFLVGHRGTRRNDPDHADLMFGFTAETAELYFPDEPVRIELDLSR